ncbi:hypothetical protein [Ralstonia phage RP31]|uniref:Uncharacterized protein n=1 Tax=Ralstonia phage RP31 TaxID=1923890 RepID=A0A1L7N1F6_9CAUD|nr:hypothetical protein [Ralstonia phage RP31]
MQDPNNFHSPEELAAIQAEMNEAAPAESAEAAAPVAEEAAAPTFNPVDYLTNALHNAGYPNPTAWYKGIDPRAETADNEKDRIFFANRALRLYLAEVPDRENISPRMLLADGITSIQWTALVDQGVVPWLMNQFDKKGRRVEAPAIKEYDGTLSLSEEEKAVVRTFRDDPNSNAELALGDLVFCKVHRNGASCIEWRFANEPSVHYLLPLTALFSDATSGTPPWDELPPDAPVPGFVPSDEVAVLPEGSPLPAGGKPATWGQIPEVPEIFEPAPHLESRDEEEQDARPSSTEPEA